MIHKAVKEELLAQMHACRKDHYGPELREADEAHAQRVLRAELRRRGWVEAELARRRKGDPEKVEMALGLRRQTSMSLNWIANRLRMGTCTYLSNCLVTTPSLTFTSQPTPATGTPGFTHAVGKDNRGRMEAPPLRRLRRHVRASGIVCPNTAIMAHPLKSAGLPANPSGEVVTEQKCNWVWEPNQQRSVSVSR